jgi:hypothetical protein
VDVASDGALGIQAGVREVSWTIPLRPDLFHLLREAHRVGQRLENRAYQAIELAERARKAQQEQNQPKRRKGAPLKVKLALPEAETQEGQAIEQLDVWEWLSSEIRQALEPVDRHGSIASSRQARQTILTALELLETLNNATVREFTHPLTEKLDELLAPIEWLEQALALWREGQTGPGNRKTDLVGLATSERIGNFIRAGFACPVPGYRLRFLECIFLISSLVQFGRIAA